MRCCWHGAVPARDVLCAACVQPIAIGVSVLHHAEPCWSSLSCVAMLGAAGRRTYACAACWPGVLGSNVSISVAGIEFAGKVDVSICDRFFSQSCVRQKAKPPPPYSDQLTAVDGSMCIKVSCLCDLSFVTHTSLARKYRNNPGCGSVNPTDKRSVNNDRCADPPLLAGCQANTSSICCQAKTHAGCVPSK